MIDRFAEWLTEGSEARILLAGAIGALILFWGAFLTAPLWRAL
jgi:hypothetical protein